jgi:hypothetical protein
MDFRDLSFDVIAAIAGLSLFMEATPLATSLNHWAAKQYVRFPRMKSLPGAANAGMEWNTKVTSIWFRVCGAIICVVAPVSIAREVFLALR